MASARPMHLPFVFIVRSSCSWPTRFGSASAPALATWPSCGAVAPLTPIALDHLPVHGKRQTILDGDGTGEHKHHGPATGDSLFKDLRRPLIGYRALGLLDRHLDATKLGVIEALEIDEMPCIVDDDDGHRPLV